MRIGTKLTLSLVTPLAGIMVFYGYLNERRYREHYHEELIREGRVISRTVEIAMEDYFRDRQMSDARKVVDRITRYERILGLRLFNPDGTLSYQSASLSRLPFRDEAALGEAVRHRRHVEGRDVLGGEPVITFLNPLVGPGGALYGAVEVVQLESFIERELHAARNSTALATSLMIVLTGLIVLLVIRFSVSRPIEELALSFREVGSGDLRARVPVRTHDAIAGQIDRITRIVRRMLDFAREREPHLAPADLLSSPRRTSARARDSASRSPTASCASTEAGWM